MTLKSLPLPYRSISRHVVILSTVLVFVVAITTRMFGLGQYFTTDERFWVESSKYFLGGLLSSSFACPEATEHRSEAVVEPEHGLACTVRSGNPGVITTWSGSLGLWLYHSVFPDSRSLFEFVSTLPVDPVDKTIIPWVRFPTVLLSAAAVAVLFLVLYRFLYPHGYGVALLAALFTAVSPFEIALSRVLHNDALETTFTTFSLLAVFYYWGQNGSRRWLLLSGFLAGAGALAKSPALFLAPFVAILGGWYLLGRWLATNRLSIKLVLITLADGLSWFGAACLSFVLFWPAMWVIPKQSLYFLLSIVFTYAAGGHERGNFFLGDISHNPGLLFYPTSWLLRTTPLVLLGVLLAIAVYLGNPPASNSLPPNRWQKLRCKLGYLPEAAPVEQLFFLSLLFVISFIVFMSFGGTKQDRYLLPTYPFFSIMAAIGWKQLAGRVVGFRRNPPVLSLVLAATLALHGYLALRSFPYYFTYFNPLFGGLSKASSTITVGWGEGLDQAAEYLNQKPMAEKLKVASWYGASVFAPFFKGQTVDYFQQKGNALAGDYVVVYVNQRQRNLPDGEFFEFVDNLPLDKVIYLDSTPYVWIYRSIGLDHYLQYQRYPDLAELLGWEYTTPGVNPDHPMLQPGDRLDFDLWWEYLGKSAREPFFLWLVGPDGRIWVETTTKPKTPVSNPEQWQSGQIIAESGQIAVPVGMPPGDYTVFIGFYPEGRRDPVHAVLFNLQDNPKTISVQRGLPTQQLPIDSKPVADNAGLLQLVGYRNRQPQVEAGHLFELELYWRATGTLPQNLQISLQLLDANGVSRWSSPVEPLNSFYPTQNWPSDEVVYSLLSIMPAADVPAGEFTLALAVSANDQPVKQISLQSVRVVCEKCGQ